MAAEERNIEQGMMKGKELRVGNKEKEVHRGKEK